MKSITGVFRSSSDAERALAQFRELALPEDRLTLLTPADARSGKAIPSVSTEQPGMGKAIGALVGGAAGFSGGPLLMAVLIPGVGPITAVGLLGGACLAAMGATAGAAVGGRTETLMTDGLPGDELFVYEDALRKGRSVLIAMADDESEAARFRELLSTEGAESVDSAREAWWVGLRSAEQERYTVHNRNFGEDEKFYRTGFESALHARTRCKEYDQVMNEMTAQMEDVERSNGTAAADAFRRGYERGRDYYQMLCGEKKAA
ncbi:MAG TPA: hypothetical protein VMF10_15770 [Candidatus Aquilonibacter sp.]|nr:hypothetical protein [Candidatus Aquilonibacter sp.]